MKNRAYETYLKELEDFSQTGKNDLEGIARDISEKAQEKGIVMERDPKLLKTMIGNDLRETVPPQLYSLIAGFTEMIRELEEETYEHKQNQSGDRGNKNISR